MALLAHIPSSIFWPLVAIAIVGVFFQIFYSPPIKCNNKPLRRAPDRLPFAGNGLHFLRGRFALFDWFTHCERLYPQETLQISVPSLPPGVIISNPINVEFVLKNEGTFSKGTFFKERSWDLFGHGIINVDGRLWRLQRKAGLSFLSTSNMKTLTEEELPRILTTSISNLKAATIASGSVEHCIDLQEFFHEITTQLMGRMAYDQEMHTGDSFTEAFEYASGATANRVQNPLWRLTEVFAGSRMRRSIAVVRKYGLDIVSKAVASRQSHESSGKSSHRFVGSGSLINSLLDSIDDEQLVADAALNYLSAGRDTTAQALTWLFLLLTQHPSVTERICDEVKSHSTQDLTPASLPYTLSVFYEALRHYPPVPFELKQAEESVCLPDGTYLPAKSIVLWCLWAMNRSHAIWGPDADEFHPERWLVRADDDMSFQVRNRSAAEFPVFNGGPRMCLGKKMAESVAVKTIAAVVPVFDFSLRCDPNRRSGSSLTLPMEGGLPVSVTLRDAQ